MVQSKLKNHISGETCSLKVKTDIIPIFKYNLWLLSLHMKEISGEKHSTSKRLSSPNRQIAFWPRTLHCNMMLTKPASRSKLLHEFSFLKATLRPNSQSILLLKMWYYIYGKTAAVLGELRLHTNIASGYNQSKATTDFVSVDFCVISHRIVEPSQ